MLIAQKIEIPQKLKDELIKKHLQIPDSINSYSSYEIIYNDVYL